MILTCPRCAARYVVGEDQVGPQGRKVKCTACGEVWRVAEEPDFEIPADPYVIAPPEPEQSEAPEPPPFRTAPEETLREPVRARTRRADQAVNPILWASLATLVAVVVITIVFREEIASSVGVALR